MQRRRVKFVAVADSNNVLRGVWLSGVYRTTPIPTVFLFLVTLYPSIGYHCSPFSPQRVPSIFVIFATPQDVSFDRSANLLSQPRVKIALASRGFRHAGPSIWNSLPPHLKYINTYTAFISNLKTHLFCSAPDNSIHALLIHIYMLILAPKLFFITLHYNYEICRRSV